MSQLLAYATPPLLGAFIGYITNHIAIRMLFRPLNPVHIMGFRLPLTPGVIPRKRHELAKNIGEMVGDHLLTGPDLRKALAEESFRQDLKRTTDSRISHLLNLQLGPITSLVPERYRSYFKAGVKIMRWRFLKHLHNHIDSEAFAQGLGNNIAERVDIFLARNLDDLFSSDSRNHCFTAIEAATFNLLAGKEVDQWVHSELGKSIDRWLADNKSLNELLPQEIKKVIFLQFEALLPELLLHFSGLIKEPSLQKKIAARLSTMAKNLTSSLGPLDALAGAFINPETLERKIGEYLTEKGEDLAGVITDEDVQARILIICRAKAEQFLSTPVATILHDVKPETIAAVKQWLGDQVVTILKNPRTAAALTGLFRETMERHTEHPLKEFLTNLFGSRRILAAKQRTVEEILSIIRSPQVKRVIDRLITELVEEKILSQPIGTLADLLPREVRNSIGDYVLQVMSDIIVREVPTVLDSLNIRQVVARKVDSLNLVRLEELLMGIMQDQFKYINLFGGLLGFLIGLLNLFFIRIN